MIKLTALRGGGVLTRGVDKFILLYFLYILLAKYFFNHGK